LNNLSLEDAGRRLAACRSAEQGSGDRWAGPWDCGLQADQQTLPLWHRKHPPKVTVGQQQTSTSTPSSRRGLSKEPMALATRVLVTAAGLYVCTPAGWPAASTGWTLPTCRARTGVAATTSRSPGERRSRASCTRCTTAPAWAPLHARPRRPKPLQARRQLAADPEPEAVETTRSMRRVPLPSRATSGATGPHCPRTRCSRPTPASGLRSSARARRRQTSASTGRACMACPARQPVRHRIARADRVAGAGRARGHRAHLSM